MIEIKKKREYLNNINSYLVELEMLTKKNVEKIDLSPIDEVDKVRVKALVLQGFASVKFKVEFSEKNTKSFSDYIQNLYESNNQQVYIWTSKTNVCGLCKVDSIKEIKFSFPFGLNSEGLVVFLTVDLKDKLILDFYVDINGKEVVEVETQGLNWPKIKY